jgi:cytidylate kinase
MSRDVICVSYASGAGGEEVARLVADQLGFLYINEEIIVRAARLSGIDPERIADEERRKGMFEGLLDYLEEPRDEPTATPASTDDLPAEVVQAFVREAIVEVAERGGVVIGAHGASHATGADRRALRVLITAPPETRANRLASEEQVSVRTAVKSVWRSDAARADYLKRFYGVAQELPTHYDLVINTAELSVDEAAALIAQASSAGSRREKR